MHFRHLYSTDYLRGVAALVVTLYHFTGKDNYLPEENPLRQILADGHYGVEVFFIISGLVIPYSMEKGGYRLGKIRTFLKKRFIRIEPPYLLSVLLALLLNYLTTLTPVYHGPAFEIDYGQLAAHVGYLNTFLEKPWLNPVCWTLAIEFQFYLLVALAFPLLSSSKWYVCLVAIVTFNAVSSFLGMETIFHFSIYFTVGIALYRLLCRKSSLIETISIMVAALIFAFAKFGIKEVVVIVFTFTVILLPFPKSGVGLALGNISYSLYLVHFPVGMRVLNLAARFSSDEMIRVLAVLIALVVSLAFAILFYRLVELPCKKMASKVKYRNEGKADMAGMVPEKDLVP